MKSLFEKRSLVRLIVGLLLSASILILVHAIDRPPVSAQSITGINAQISTLRSRINRLESEISRLQQSSRSNLSSPSKAESLPRSGNPPVVDGEAIGRSDPLYERLATLLIELKEDVRNIDRRLADVEQQVSEQ